MRDILRAPAERLYADELAAARRADDRPPEPEGWRLSPRAVRAFVLGDRKLRGRARSSTATTRSSTGASSP